MAKLHVYYAASGNEAIVKGKFKGLVQMPGEPPLSTPIIDVTEDSRVAQNRIRAGQVLVIDNRCLVVDVDTGQVVYNPRDHLVMMTAPLRAWMDENSSWPASKLTEIGKRTN